MTTVMPTGTDPSVDTPEYEATKRSGADRATLVRNLVESNFHGLRRLQAYTMAGWDKRQAFSRDLAKGKQVDSCPFPMEIALLRALHMGLNRWRGPGTTQEEMAASYIASLRFGVMAPHLSAVVEYEPEVFWRAFQGVEVHRDVPFLEDSARDGGDARSLDWMDFRIYLIPPLEKDLLWDLFQMDRSPWADPKPVINLGQVALPEQREKRLLPTMVARERNRYKASDGRQIIGMATPGASLHLNLVSGNPAEIGDVMPALLGTAPPGLQPPAMEVKELRENDNWLVVTYQPPPPMADVRLMVVPPQLRVEETL